MPATHTETHSSHASRVALLAIFGLLAGAILLGSLSARAQAETAVTVGPAEVSTALFVAGDIARLSKVPGGTEELVLEKALQQLYADEPALAPTTAEGYIVEMKILLAAASAPSQASLELMAGNQRILAIIAALERPYGSPAVELSSAAKLAVTHLAAVALSGSSDIFASTESPKYFEPQADARTNLTYTTFAPATVLRATRELAAVNRPFGEARDALWKTASEESVFSEWEALLSESKQVLDTEALKQLREAIEAGHGSITEEPEHLTALFTQGQQRTQEQACEHAGGPGEEAIGGESIKGILPLKCSGGALYEAAHARSCGDKEECEAKLVNVQTQAQKQARMIAEERAAMIAAAELLRPSDNTAAALQQATAQAQAQITEDETAYASYEAEQAQKQAIANGVKSGALGASAALAIGTGDYAEGISGLIGVAFELYEHTEEGLQKPPPGPQEITLKDLADVSTQLAGFQQYTQEAFHALNTQLAELTSQLARENYELKEELGSLGEKLEERAGHDLCPAGSGQGTLCRPDESRSSDHDRRQRRLAEAHRRTAVRAEDPGIPGCPEKIRDRNRQRGAGQQLGNPALHLRRRRPPVDEQNDRRTHGTQRRHHLPRALSSRTGLGDGRLTGIAPKHHILGRKRARLRPAAARKREPRDHA